MGVENRASPRYATEAAIEIEMPGGSASGRTSNVSRGGFAAVVDTAIAPGETVQVKISLVFSEDSFSESLALEARIAWATALNPSEHQIGAAFIKMSADQKNYLDLFLRYLQDAVDDDPSDDDGGDDENDDPFAS